MPHEQYITLETARLAKQAGFDWEVNARYAILAKCTVTETTIFREITDFPLQNYNRFDDTFSAPTQAVLQRWLREVKNREVVVDIDPRIAHCYEPMIGTVNKYADDNTPAVKWQRISERQYPTFEAALEAGLQKCLTIIIEQQ